LGTFVVDTSCSPFAKLRPVTIESIDLEDVFWAPRLQNVREVTLPSQYQLCEETGRLFNFRRTSGEDIGNFQGFFFNDSDVYKWVEAVGFSLAGGGDQKLHDLAEQAIRLIVAAQDEDGYLDTYFTFERKKDRWTNLRDMHELYCAGHLMQGAIAYYRATGENDLLEAACRLADRIGSMFGPDKRPGAPGHPEVEMALVELYRTTGNEDYINLAKFFIDKRGTGVIGGGGYHIDHKPLRELSEIVGHAVRSLYLNCGAADVYMETGDKTLWDALVRLWNSMTEYKTYITGGVGPRYEGEAFGENYELPSARAYAETCAAIANVMWNWRMLQISGKARFADVMELALYNGVISGISLDGKNYFYVNPLADRGHHRRQSWFECACCPPNVARLLASLPGYFYSLSTEGVWVHLYAKNTAHLKVNRSSLAITQQTKYPWDGEIKMVLQPQEEMTFSLFLRIPGWCRKAEVKVNSKILDTPVQPGRYAEVRRLWKAGDRVHLSFSMPVEQIISHPHVIENNDRVALKRGPIVYCVEQVDNPDFDPWSLVLPADASVEVIWEPKLLDGIIIVRGEALAADEVEFKRHLYRPLTSIASRLRHVKFVAIPYCAWANREPGPMIVWIRSIGQLLRN